jgi:hypothetical protein
MDNFVNLQIILKNSSSTNNKNNKNLFKFLNLNYEEILQSNYYIQLILLTKNNYKSFSNEIKNTPALINNSDNTTIIGTYNIINYLITLCEGSPYNEDNQSLDEEIVTQKTSNDELHDFLLNEALAEDSIEEPLDLNKVKDKENKYKLKQEKQKQINPKLKKNMINTIKTNNQNLNSSIEKLPKDEKNIYDNQELTQTRPISDYMSDDKDLKNFWENMVET